MHTPNARHSSSPIAQELYAESAKLRARAKQKRAEGQKHEALAYEAAAQRLDRRARRESAQDKRAQGLRKTAAAHRPPPSKLDLLRRDEASWEAFFAKPKAEILPPHRQENDDEW